MFAYISDSMFKCVDTDAFRLHINVKGVKIQYEILNYSGFLL